MTKPQIPGQSRRGLRPVSDLERFEAKLLPEPNSGCMLWDSSWKYTGTSNSQIRGMFSLKGKLVKAHRAAWEFYCGPIPDGMHVLHKCDVPLCCRPDHLYLGTHQDNMDDMAAKKRRKHLRGEAHPSAKATAAIVHMIRTSGASIDVLAAQTGINRTTVHRIRVGKLWRHVS